jgi:hypothetical protein
MKKMTLFALALTALGIYFVPWATTQTTSEAQTQAVVTATTAFLNTLNPDQRQKVLFVFTPQKTATVARFARRTRRTWQEWRTRGRPSGRRFRQWDAA